MNRAAIVCIDDETIILNSLSKQLKRNLGHNYDIELASSGEEALALCAELKAEGIPIALVISDQTMPGMSGDEFLIIFHSYYPKTIKILLTGQANADSVGNIINAAALYRYIAKPWDETDLILTVKEALRRYGQEQQLARHNILLKQTNRSLKQSNQKLLKSLDLLLATLEAADDGILVLDNQGKVVIFNQNFISIWNISPSFMPEDSSHLLGLISRRLSEPLSCNLTTKKSQKYQLLRLIDGRTIECYSQIQQLQEKTVGTVWGFRDVTAKEKEKAIALSKTQHNTLSQLPKRRILSYQLANAITEAKSKSHRLAVMFLDLDRFKTINDTLGYKTGDLLLKQVVQRLKECIRGEDIIARWGDNEFTLLLPHIDSKTYTKAIAQRILTALKSPFKIANNPIHITVSIGIATYPEHGTDAETLLKNVNIALFQARQIGRHNYKYYDTTFSSQA